MTVLSATCESKKDRALRLLVVEADHTKRAQIPEPFLAKSGYEVVLASDGAEALRVLQSEDLPTLAIFDWIVLYSDMWQEIRHLKDKGYLYVIVLLNSDERQHQGDALAGGADDCVDKSTDMEQLHWHIQFGAQVILERALRDSEERFRIAFEQSATGMAMVNVSNGRFVHVNQAMCDFLGYSREELLAKEIMSVSHPDNVPSSPLLTAQMASGGFNGEEIERRYIRKDGAVVWSHVSLSLVHDEAGRCTYVSAQFKDITKRKAAEEAQQRAEVFAHAIMDNIDDLVMVINTEGKWYYASASHLDGLGYAPCELIGQDVFCTFHPDDRLLVDNAMQQVFRTGRAPIISVRRLHKDGTVRYFEARGTLARGVCGAGDGIVVVSRTI